MARWFRSRWHVLREPTVPFLLLACVVHVVRRDAVDFTVFFGTAVVIFVDAGRPRQDEAGLGPARESSASAPVLAPSSGVRTEARSAHGRRRFGWVALGMTGFAAFAALPALASLGSRLVMAAIGVTALAVVWWPPTGEPSGHTGVAARARRGEFAATSAGPGAARGGHASARRPLGSRVGAARGWPLWAGIGLAACLWELASFIAQQVWPADQADHPAASDLIGPLLAGWPGRAVFLLLWAGAGWWLLQRLRGSGIGTGSTGGARAALDRADGARPRPGPGRHTQFRGGTDRSSADSLGEAGR